MSKTFEEVYDEITKEYLANKTVQELYEDLRDCENAMEANSEDWGDEEFGDILHDYYCDAFECYTNIKQELIRRGETFDDE